MSGERLHPPGKCCRVAISSGGILESQGYDLKVMKADLVEPPSQIAVQAGVKVIKFSG